MSKPADITIIRSFSRTLAKKITPAGEVLDFDNARRFCLTSERLAGLHDLGELLSWLLARPDLAIVRGAIADPDRCRWVRRLQYPDPETGELPTLIDAPRSWVALDAEHVPLGDTDPRDLPACAALALHHLPDAFQGASCIAQATGTHGFRPDARLRFWFWLSRPTRGTELREWTRGIPAIDPAIFSPVQPTYTSSPVMLGGAIDPLPRRQVVLDGAPVVTVPPPAALISPPPAPRPARAAGSPRWNRYVELAVTGACERVATTAEGARHRTLSAQAWYLAAEYADDGNASDIIDRLFVAGLQSGLDEKDVERTIRAAFQRAARAA